MTYRLPSISLRTPVAPGMSDLNPQPLPPGPPPPDLGIIAILIG